MFQELDYWDWALGAAAAYVAVVSLLRLMAAERRRLLDQVQRQLTQPNSPAARSLQKPPGQAAGGQRPKDRNAAV